MGESFAQILKKEFLEVAYSIFYAFMISYILSQIFHFLIDFIRFLMIEPWRK